MTRFSFLCCLALALPAAAKGPLSGTSVPASASFQAVPLAGYETLWAVSDLHGHLDRLKEGGLEAPEPSTVAEYIAA